MALLGSSTHPSRVPSPSFWGLFFFAQSDICLKESKKKSASFRLTTWWAVGRRWVGGAPRPVSWISSGLVQRPTRAPQAEVYLGLEPIPHPLPALTPPPWLQAGPHLVCDLDEEAAAFPGGELQLGSNGLAHVAHSAAAAHLHHLRAGRQRVRPRAWLQSEVQPRGGLYVSLLS